MEARRYRVERVGIPVRRFEIGYKLKGLWIKRQYPGNEMKRKIRLRIGGRKELRIYYVKVSHVEMNGGKSFIVQKVKHAQDSSTEFPRDLEKLSIKGPGRAMFIRPLLTVARSFLD